MKTIKKFSVETHKGWASFQAWIKKWNKIMAVIFSALGITLLLSTVIVNALEVHEENQELLKLGNENSRLNLFEVCRNIQEKICWLRCSACTSRDILNELSHHWESNTQCQSNGLSIEISSTVHFPRFTIPADWLNGTFQLRELHIDAENVFEINENAFAGAMFARVQKLVLINLHLHSMDIMTLQKLFVQQNYTHLTITKNSPSEQLANVTFELYPDSKLSSESEAKHHVRNENALDDLTLAKNVSRGLFIALAVVGCILGFCLGLLTRYNPFKNKTNKSSNTNRVIFVIENEAAYLRESVVMQNEK